MRKLDERQHRRVEIQNSLKQQAASVVDDLACIAQTKGWVYAQHVANGICEEFKCKPTDPEWQTYTTIQYAFRRLFDFVKLQQPASRTEPLKAPEGPSRVEQIESEIRSTYGRSRGNADSSKGTGSSGRPRAGGKRIRTSSGAASTSRSK